MTARDAPPPRGLGVDLELALGRPASSRSCARCTRSRRTSAASAQYSQRSRPRRPRVLSSAVPCRCTWCAIRWSRTRWRGCATSATPCDEFRRLARRVSLLLAAEATRDLALAEASVETPLERTAVRTPRRARGGGAGAARRPRHARRVPGAGAPGRRSATSASSATRRPRSRGATTRRCPADLGGRRSCSCSTRCWPPAARRPWRWTA